MKAITMKLSYQMPCGCCTREVTIMSHYSEELGYSKAIAVGCAHLFEMVQQETNLVMVAPYTVAVN